MIQSEECGESVVCTVKDEGIGIDESKLEQLFTVFTQEDMSLSRSYDGIGLGLASSHNLARLLQGSLSVSNNKPEKGCTFTLHIPVARQ